MRPENDNQPQPSPGVTNRVTRYWGGDIVTENFRDGKWTRETRSTSYNAAGGRVETVVTESSDYPTVTNSVTVYDFLGRVVSVTAPLGVTSNFYDGASDRVIRMSRTGSPDTLYVYDALCNVAATALDADGDGQVSYTGTDRISASGTRYEEDTSNVWWRVTASAVWNQTGVDAGLTSAVTRVRMTGLGTDTYNGGILTAQTESIDWPGNVTRTSTYTDAANANVWTVTETPGSVQPAIQKTVAGHAVSMVSSTAVTNTCTYDGFARQTGATDGRGNTSLTVYNTLGQVAYTEDAASNRTAYAYDAFGRQNAVTPPLSNTVFTAYDSLGNVAAQWGGTYPVEHGYDSQGRRISMKTFRVANGAGDETRWLYDNATGLLTNKVYADNSRVSYTYTPSGRLASRVWARGVTTAYTYDALGQLSGIGYSDATPDITFAYDRLGRMTSAVTEVSSNLFEYSGLDLVGEIQNGEAIVRIYDSLGRSVGFNWATDYFVGYCYDALGRLVAVTSTVDSVTGGWGYGYLPGTDLIKGWVSDDGFVFDRTYENNRNLLSAVTNRFGTSLVGAFGYFNDEEARRTKRLDGTGVLAVTNAFGYNAYGELVSACTGTNTYGYGYDPIGNRISATNNAEAWAYVANAINQYAGVTGTVHVTPMYDADGNTVSFGEWTFVWDAENRLVTASNAAMVVANTYDYRSRRITKRVNNDETRFVYDGWALIGELKTTGTVSYVYGPDLSGALQGAGTVGGLLCRVTGNEAQHYAYDGNGNVVALVSVGNGSNAAKYEYCPFGETISATGSFAGTNPFRFSTKYFDAETGLLMYQLRPLILSMCRWLNRDPIEEKGGLNLYCFLKNNPIGAYDYLGLQECDCPSEKVDLKIAEMIRAAIKNTVKNPVSIDLKGVSI